MNCGYCDGTGNEHELANRSAAIKRETELCQHCLGTGEVQYIVCVYDVHQISDPDEAEHRNMHFIGSDALELDQAVEFRFHNSCALNWCAPVEIALPTDGQSVPCPRCGQAVK